MNALAEAATAADKAREWTERRDDAIRRARAEGASLRRVGEAVGLTHAAVAKIERRT